MTDLVFLDTETLGLDPDAPIWEFAAVRRLDPVGEMAVEFTIHHDPAGWLNGFPEQFANDYHARYDETTAWCERAAARQIYLITKGACVIGAVPSFDTERLAKLLRRNGFEPEWHYQPIDIEAVVAGYLKAEQYLKPGSEYFAGLTSVLQPPWDSNALSGAIGVNPEDYARHTAMGDVRWTMAQWDAVF